MRQEVTSWRQAALSVLAGGIVLFSELAQKMTKFCPGCTSVSDASKKEEALPFTNKQQLGPVRYYLTPKFIKQDDAEPPLKFFAISFGGGPYPHNALILLSEQHNQRAS